MKIDVTKIEGYAEMSAEDKLKALENLEIEESQGEEEIEKYKNLLQKANSQAADYKKQLRDKLSEQERLEAERQEKDAEKDALLKQLLKEKDVSKYQAQFLENGFDSDLAMKSAEALADGDYATVFANLKTYTEGLKKSVKTELLKATPKPDNKGEGGATITKEQFEKMGYTERVQFKKEYPDLYTTYTQ